MESLPGQPHLLLIKYPKDTPGPSGAPHLKRSSVLRIALEVCLSILGCFANVVGEARLCHDLTMNSGKGEDEGKDVKRAGIAERQEGGEVALK